MTVLIIDSSFENINVIIFLIPKLACSIPNLYKISNILMASTVSKTELLESIKRNISFAWARAWWN